MNSTITAVYENGVLRPLTPLTLPEHSRVELQIVTQAAAPPDREQVRQALLAAGVIHPQPAPEERPVVISEAELTAAAEALGRPGPLSVLIISEREGR